MAKPEYQIDLQAARNMIAEAELILTTTELPQGRAERCRELLTAALALMDDISQGATNPAVMLGAKGGSATVQKHGSDHFRQLAAKRKTKAGGRPRKQAE
jgi:hypothetical protein